MEYYQDISNIFNGDNNNFMNDQESLVLSEYEFTATVSKGANLKTNFPCVYHISLKNLAQLAPGEIVSEHRMKANERGDVFFHTELKIVSQIIFNKQTEVYNPKKSNIYLYYLGEEKPNEPKMAGVITLDLATFVESTQNPESVVYNLERTPLKQGTIEIKIQASKIKDIEIQSFRQTKSLNNSLTNSIKSFERDRNERTAELVDKKGYSEMKQEVIQVRKWTPQLEINLDRSRNSSRGDDARRDKRKIKELEYELTLANEEIQYQKLRNEKVIKELEESKEELGMILKKVNEKESEYDKTLGKSEEELFLIYQKLEREKQIRESAEAKLEGALEKLNISKQRIEEQTQKIVGFEETLGGVQVLQSDILKLQEENSRLKQNSLSNNTQPMNSIESSKIQQLHQIISQLEMEQSRAVERGGQEKEKNRRLEQELIHSESKYDLMIEENKFLLQTIERLSADLASKDSQLGDLRAEYEAYRLHRHSRKQIKDSKEKSRIDEYQRQQRALSDEVIRLNEELFNYREVEGENFELKKELAEIRMEIDNLKGESSREKSHSAASKSSKLFEDSYVQELNIIINEYKLEQGKLNQKLVQVERENDQLKRLIGNSVEIGMLESVVNILKTELVDKTPSELMSLLTQRRAQQQSSMGNILNFNDVIHQVLLSLTSLKSLSLQHSQPELQKKAVSLIKHLQTKLSSVLTT